MRKLIKGITKTYLYATSAYFTFISIQLIISTYKKYEWAKENKKYIDDVNGLAKVLKDAGYLDGDV